MLLYFPVYIVNCFINLGHNQSEIRQQRQNMLIEIFLKVCLILEKNTHPNEITELGFVLFWMVTHKQCTKDVVFVHFLLNVLGKMDFKFYLVSGNFELQRCSNQTVESRGVKIYFSSELLLRFFFFLNLLRSN